MTVDKASPAVLSPLSIMKAIWNRRFLIVFVWLAVSAIGMAVIMRLPSIYAANALVVVESQRIPENFVSATVNANLQDRLNALRQEILTFSRLAQIIHKFDLYSRERKRRPMEEVVDMMRADITIALERGVVLGRPGAFHVTYQGPDPPIVAQVANLIASFFIDENLRARETEAVGTSDFLNAQLAEAKQRLDQQEAQLSKYKLDFNGELPQQENALLTALGQMKVQLAGTQESISRAYQNKTALQSSLESAEALLRMVEERPEIAASVVNGAAANPLPQERSDVQRLQAELDSLRTRYSDNHPDVKTALTMLAKAKQLEAERALEKPKKETSAGVGETVTAAARPRNAHSLALLERIQTSKVQIANANHEIATLTEERQKLIAEITATEARLQHLPVREQQLSSITRDYEVTKQNYKSLLEKKLAADVAADMEKRQKSERFVMLEMARTPEVPVRPKRLLLIAAASVFGVVIGVVAGAGLEMKKGVVLGEWELPADTIVLGRVPRIVMRQPGRTARRRRLRRAMASVLCIVMAVIAAGTWYRFFRH